MTQHREVLRLLKEKGIGALRQSEGGAAQFKGDIKEKSVLEGKNLAQLSMSLSKASRSRSYDSLQTDKYRSKFLQDLETLEKTRDQRVADHKWTLTVNNGNMQAYRQFIERDDNLGVQTLVESSNHGVIPDPFELVIHAIESGSGKVLTYLLHSLPLKFRNGFYDVIPRLVRTDRETGQAVSWTDKDEAKPLQRLLSAVLRAPSDQFTMLVDYLLLRDYPFRHRDNRASRQLLAFYILYYLHDLSSKNENTEEDAARRAKMAKRVITFFEAAKGAEGDALDHGIRLGRVFTCLRDDSCPDIPVAERAGEVERVLTYWSSFLSQSHKVGGLYTVVEPLLQLIRERREAKLAETIESARKEAERRFSRRKEESGGLRGKSREDIERQVVGDLLGGTSAADLKRDIFPASFLPLLLTVSFDESDGKRQTTLARERREDQRNAQRIAEWAQIRPRVGEREPLRNEVTSIAFQAFDHGYNATLRALIRVFGARILLAEENRKYEIAGVYAAPRGDADRNLVEKAFYAYDDDTGAVDAILSLARSSTEESVKRAAAALKPECVYGNLGTQSLNLLPHPQRKVTATYMAALWNNSFMDCFVKYPTEWLVHMLRTGSTEAFNYVVRNGPVQIGYSDPSVETLFDTLAGSRGSRVVPEVGSGYGRADLEVINMQLDYARDVDLDGREPTEGSSWGLVGPVRKTLRIAPATAPYLEHDLTFRADLVERLAMECDDAETFRIVFAAAGGSARPNFIERKLRAGESVKDLSDSERRRLSSRTRDSILVPNKVRSYDPSEDTTFLFLLAASNFRAEIAQFLGSTDINYNYTVFTKQGGEIKGYHILDVLLGAWKDAVSVDADASSSIPTQERERISKRVDMIYNILTSFKRRGSTFEVKKEHLGRWLSWLKKKDDKFEEKFFKR